MFCWSKYLTTCLIPCQSHRSTSRNTYEMQMKTIRHRSSLRMYALSSLLLTCTTFWGSPLTGVVCSMAASLLAKKSESMLASCLLKSPSHCPSALYTSIGNILIS